MTTPDPIELMARKRHASDIRMINRHVYRGYTETQWREIIEKNWPYESERYLKDAQAALAALKEHYAIVPIFAGDWLPINRYDGRSGAVQLWRKDAGVFYGVFGTCEIFHMTEADQEELGEDAYFQEDWWAYDQDGMQRLEGDLRPTFFRYLDEDEPSAKAMIESGEV